jgi:hypothetical protein
VSDVEAIRVNLELIRRYVSTTHLVLLYERARKENTKKEKAKVLGIVVWKRAGHRHFPKTQIVEIIMLQGQDPSQKPTSYVRVLSTVLTTFKRRVEIHGETQGTSEASLIPKTTIEIIVFRESMID